jgi:bifunctional non-homologous end joining protein LigD
MGAMEKEEQSSLYYTEGASDKEYHAKLVRSPGGFLVNFLYGRRGQALKSGTKTVDALPYVEAKKVFDKLVSEKLAKGYTVAVSGAAYQDSPREKSFTGIVPQLLNPIEEEEIPGYVSDSDWWFQEKMDGERRPVQIRHRGAIVGINRSGLQVALPKVLEDALAEFPCDAVVDGEIVGSTLHLWDIMECAGKDVRGQSYEDRLLTLTGLCETLSDCASEVVRLVYTGRTAAEKKALVTRLKGAGAEGVCAKEKHAPYTPGRPNSGGSQLKFKFWASATLQVKDVNGKKRSVSFIGFDGNEAIDLGNVTIPANRTIPRPGAIVEIRYLYAYPGGSLFEPTFLGERSDVDVQACTVSQLKYKSDAAAESRAPAAAAPRPR